MSTAVLVTDGEQRAALAIVRSLGRAGHRLFVASASGASLAGSSRYAVQEASLPDPMSEPAAYADEVERLCREWRIGVLLPVTDASLLALLPRRDRFGDLCLPYPDVETFLEVSNKASLLEHARALGIAVPPQEALERREDRVNLDLDELEYPIVAKPARSVTEGKGRREKFRVIHAAGPGELRQELDELPEGAFPVLLQRRVLGPGVGIFLLLWGGETLALFSHRRLREKPPSGGVSVYRESVPADPELIRRSAELLERYAWQGVAMVEYKIDEPTGTPYLMEVNGRFWGSLQLAIDAGVDFPALLVEAALGRAPTPVLEYRAGVRSRWWWGDIDQLLSRLRRSPTELSLPVESGGRWRALREFLALWRPGDRSEVFRLHDARPFLRETRQWFSSLRAPD